MHDNFSISVSTLLAFILVLSRVTGVFVFIPMPFKDAGPGLARVVLALGCTIALYSRWPTVNLPELTLTSTFLFVLSDAALGAAMGLMVSFLSEAFTVGAQSLALQAGYGYVSIIDPTTQAESDVLAVLAQLLAGLFFFATGIHRVLIKGIADSLDRYPPGTFVLTPGMAREVVTIGADIFSIGLRLALPIIGLLLMTEISLALVGKINSQLHLGTHSYPIKLLLALSVLSSVLVVSPRLYESYAAEILTSIRHLFLPVTAHGLGRQ